METLKNIEAEFDEKLNELKEPCFLYQLEFFRKINPVLGVNEKVKKGADEINLFEIVELKKERVLHSYFLDTNISEQTVVKMKCGVKYLIDDGSFTLLMLAMEKNNIGFKKD